MSYVSSLFHLVFNTYNRKPTIIKENSGYLYAIIGAEIKKKKSKPLIINGVSNHIHILVGLSPEVALSDLVRDVKSRSSLWAKRSGLFPDFEGWGKEYGAFSISETHKEAVYKYIENQQAHHLETTTEQEFERLVSRAGLSIYCG